MNITMQLHVLYKSSRKFYNMFLRIGENPSATIFQEWTDTKTFFYLKYTLIYNYV